MKVLSISLVCSVVVGFYLFYYLDLVPPIVLGGTFLVLCFLSKFYYTTNTGIIIALQNIVLFCAIGSLLGYLNGFRYLLAHNTSKDMALVNMRIVPDVEIIAQQWYEHISAYLSRDASALLIALLTGRKEYIHLGFIDLVRYNGLNHLLALSGFHLSLIIMILQYMWVLIGKVLHRNINRYIIDIVTIVLVWGYCIFIGFIPSLYRAAVMFTISVCIRLYYNKSTFIVVWCISLCVLSFAVPSIMYSHGFILSMLALLGIEIGLRYACILNKILPLFLAAPLSIGMWASILTTWYVYIFFGASYPVGIIMSILLTPLVALFMCIGIVFIILSSIASAYPLLEKVVHIMAYGINYYIYGIKRILSYSAHTLSLESVVQIIVFYIVICGSIVLYYLITSRKIYGYTRKL